MSETPINVRITCDVKDWAALKDLNPIQGDLKKISKKNYRRLKKSILDHGINAPFLVWQDGEKLWILDGHQRKTTLEKMGGRKEYDVPHLLPIVKVQAESYADAKRQVLTMVSQYGSLTEEGFSDFLSDVDFDLQDIANDFKLPDFDIESYIEKHGSKDEGSGQSNGSEDEVPDVKNAVCKVGQVWALGQHRLMCGDSTDKATVEKLMNGENIDMVFTDPPYGMNAVSKDGQVGGGTKAAPAGKYKPVHGDENTDIARACYDLLVGMEFPIIVYWGANYFTDFLPPTSGWIYWHKDRPEGLTFSDGELAWTNLNKPLKAFKVRWDGYHREGERNDKRVHPTQKPILLAEKCFDNYKNIKSVLDLFGGSGSTLIACEKTNRKCFMMELDPHYCDVIIARWEKYTGKKAELLE